MTECRSRAIDRMGHSASFIAWRISSLATANAIAFKHGDGGVGLILLIRDRRCAPCVATGRDVTLVRNLRSLAVCAALALLAPVAAMAAPPSFTSNLPIGLAPGAPYILAFVTNGRIDATSSDINTYNNFVQAEAARNPSLPATTWAAGISTLDVSLISNFALNCGGFDCTYDVPIFLVTGEKVIGGFGAFFGGLGQFPVLHALNVDQFGKDPGQPAPVWTGSSIPGLGYAGSLTGGVGYGVYFSTDFSRFFGGYDLPDKRRRLYAFSGVLGASVPEPATWGMMVLGFGAVGATLRRRSKRALPSDGRVV